MRSPLKVVEEMELLNKNLGAEYFNLQGSGIYAFKKSPLNSNNKWYEDFFNQLVKRKLNEKIYWAFATRIDTAEPEMFIKAKEAGCVKVTLGIESGNEMILKKIKKKCTKKHIYDIVQSAKNSGIHSVHANFILGLPYETRETAGDTLEMIGSLPLDGVGVSILDIYPGTDVFDMVEKSEGGLNWLPGKRMNWESYTRLEVQVSVNDLTKDDLLDLREEALERWRAKKITGVDGQGNKQLVALIKFYRERLKQVAKLKNIYKTRLNQS